MKPVVANASGQQGGGVALAERPQSESFCALPRHQAPELVATGHHDEVPRTGQQRANLVGVVGVVEQHQHPSPGEPAAQHRRPFLHCGGDGLGEHPDATQNPRQRGVGGHRRARRVPAQVQKQLSVGELVSRPVKLATVERQLPRQLFPRDRRLFDVGGQ
jgi:hypothetical protein